MIRTGSNSAIIRATVVHDDGREVLIEAELARVGRNKVQVNRQKLARTKDLLGVMRTTVFSRKISTWSKTRQVYAANF